MTLQARTKVACLYHLLFLSLSVSARHIHHRPVHQHFHGQVDRTSTTAAYVETTFPSAIQAVETSARFSNASTTSFETL